MSTKWQPRGLEHWMAKADENGRPFTTKPKALKRHHQHRARRLATREIRAEVCA